MKTILSKSWLLVGFYLLTRYWRGDIAGSGNYVGTARGSAGGSAVGRTIGYGR